MRRSSRGRPEAEDVAIEHALPPVPVEGDPCPAGGLPQPCLPCTQAAAGGLPDLWPVRRPPGCRARLRSLTTMGGKKPGAAADPAPLLEALGVTLDAELLTLALRHRSYAYENGGL